MTRENVLVCCSTLSNFSFLSVALILESISPSEDTNWSQIHSFIKQLLAVVLTGLSQI